MSITAWQVRARQKILINPVRALSNAHSDLAFLLTTDLFCGLEQVHMSFGQAPLRGSFSRNN